MHQFLNSKYSGLSTAGYNESAWTFPTVRKVKVLLTVTSPWFSATGPSSPEGKRGGSHSAAVKKIKEKNKEKTSQKITNTTYKVCLC